jgi:Acetyltransferase (GNAT) domain
MHQALNKLQTTVLQAPLAEKYFIENENFLRLRPVDPSRDLQLFFSWMEDPHLRSNWRLRENSGRLARHYQQFLESENRQSFLVEKCNQPLFQFDIFLIHFHELYFRIPTTTGDCILHFIMLLNEHTVDELKNALLLQLDYFFSFPECRRLWLPVLEMHSELMNIFTEAGFVYKTSYTARQERYALFYLKRAAYTTDQTPNR